MLMLVCSSAFSQNAQLYVIEPFPLEITYNKTVNLIFPYPVQSVDKGSRDLLAQKAKAAENILQIKAARNDFAQTNLTVITSDGKLYSFLVDYADDPVQLNIELIKDQPSVSVSKAAGVQPNQALLKNTAEHIASLPANLRRIKDSAYKTSFSLSGLYIEKDVLYCRLSVDNHTSISYDIESLRFFISDKKQVKRTAAQQTEIQPLYVHADTAVVAANTSHAFVFALSKFTIPDAKQLTIQLMEKNGGRHLRLDIQNKTIMRAKPAL